MKAIAVDCSPLQNSGCFNEGQGAEEGKAEAKGHASSDPLEPCINFRNCILTKWNPPAGTDAETAARTLKKVIESYPQEGQNEVDLGGWTNTVN